MPETAASTEFGPRRTLVILAIVAGCFAVLLPKIFYPMLTASLTPSAVHQVDGSGCCDVIFESDVTAVDIMQELCLNIIRHHQVDPRVRDALGASKFSKLTPSSASLCREEVLAKCGIDLSSFLAEKERLKKSYKQVLEEIRGFNGSLCLKMQFGVPLARLGTPHLIRYHILMPHSPIRQERQTPPHAGSYHPALRERGRAIPSSHIVPKIQDRPDHMTAPVKMRPPMGGAGHVVAAPKGNGFVGLLMPLYTIGIVIFFLYTLTKVLMGIFMPIYTIGNIVSFLYKVLQVLRKSSDSEIIRPEYSTASAEKDYQKIVFNPEIFAAAVTAVNGSQYEQNLHSTSAGEPEQTPTIEELKEHQTPKSNGLAAGVNPNSKDSNVSEEQHNNELEELSGATPTVKVVNMEMTATCEGGQRYSRPTTPTLLAPHGHQEETKEKSPPISIYLEGSLPPQCELLVTDSKTQELLEEESVEVPVVLSGKMTLSLISLDQEFQDELASETPQYKPPNPVARLSHYTDESNAKAKVHSSSEKIEVLQEKYLVNESSDEEDEGEEEEEVSEEDSDNDNLLTSNRKLLSNLSKNDQQTLEQNYIENSSEDFETDEESHDAFRQSCNEDQLETPTVENQSSEAKNEEDEEEENEDDYDEESESYSEDGNEDEDVEEIYEEYEDDDNDETNKLNSLQSDSDDDENKKTRLINPFGRKKAN